MSNSPLATYTRISPNKYNIRNHKIDTITIHCYVAQQDVATMADWLCNPAANASANYVIDKNGRIGLLVEEKDASWCSSSYNNDNRAITIECASDMQPPYAINDAVYRSLIDLCEDICRRNGIDSLKWRNDPSLIGQVDKQNMTVHRWFKNKDCPGEYIFSRLGQIADEVNARLRGEKVSASAPKTPAKSNTPYEVRVLIDDLNIRTEPSMSGSVVGWTGKGTFTIVEEKDGWGKLKSGAGWIYLENPEYCKIVGKVSANGEFKVQVGIVDLNIRTGPGVGYTKTGECTGKGIFTIVEEKNGWGKLKSGAGWISLNYATRL